MSDSSTVILYHGTDFDSALKILNYGLDPQDLEFWQRGRRLQSGPGWYTTDDIIAASYFASIAPGNRNRGNTIIVMEMFLEHLEMLLEQGVCRKETIRNVYFEAEQYWFDLKTLSFLNENAIFRPYFWEDQ